MAIAIEEMMRKFFARDHAGTDREARGESAGDAEPMPPPPIGIVPGPP
jgi:hypothetical protein